MPEIAPVLIFDLDGTILSINSFPVWVRTMLFGRFAQLSRMERVTLSLCTAKILAERKLLRRSHTITKQRMQALWTQALARDKDQTALRELCALLQRHVRPSLKAILYEAAQGNADALLATSAAGEYAQTLGKELGFTHILTTPLITEPDKRENSRERKCERVMEFLAAQGWSDRKRIFFTDHEEDLPLIRKCALNLWFGEDMEVHAIRTQAPQVKIVACRHLPAKEIMESMGGNQHGFTN